MASRALVFIDGQNLYRSAKDTFGYTFPNYNVLALARKVCELSKDCDLCGVFFYTGFPDAADDAFWNRFWSKKLLAIARQGVKTFSRALRYRNEKIDVSDGVTIERRIGREKGIDVRISLDIVRLAIEQRYDTAIILSQDQDLSEVADDVRKIAKTQGRTVRIVSAFPWRAGYYHSMNDKGINKTDWIKIDRASYDECIDTFDYRS